MKRFLILLVAFSTFISCNHPEIKTLLIDETTDAYHLKIFRIENKVNEKGEAECDHYGYFRHPKDTFLSYGHNVIELIVSNFNTNHKYFDFSVPDSLENFYTSVELISILDKELDNSQIINEEIMDYFNICIEKNDSMLKGYTLKKMDSFNLPNSQQLSTEIITTNKSISFRKTDLSTVSRFYEAYMSWYIDENQNDTLKYDMDVKLIGDVESARKEFQKLGLDLEEAVFEKKFYKVYSCK